MNDVHAYEGWMTKLVGSEPHGHTYSWPRKILHQPAIPVIDVRRGGPVTHARLRLERMMALRDACFSLVPGSRVIAPALDRLASTLLARTPSPYLDEIAAISDLAAGGGVWSVNACYEWGCTTRIDAAPIPFLRRTLDWPFPGLGRHVEVALQDGGAGIYANVTWPGAIGVLTAMAPGRFAAAINQAPMFRRTRGPLLVPVDVVLNTLEAFRHDGCWPAAHLLRRIFDVCATFEEAVEVLSTASVIKPVIYSIIGPSASQACLIERTQTEAVVRRGDSTIANDWHPTSPARDGYWKPRSASIRRSDDSERRRKCLEEEGPGESFEWVREPVLNRFTRLAVETSAASGELRVLGFEPVHKWADRVTPATAALDLVVDAEGIRPVAAHTMPSVASNEAKPRGNSAYHFPTSHDSSDVFTI
jgi:hypothetical protein